MQEGRPEQGSQNPLEYSGATPEVSHPPDDHAVKGGNKQASGGKVKAVE